MDKIDVFSFLSLCLECDELEALEFLSIFQSGEGDHTRIYPNVRTDVQSQEKKQVCSCR